MTVCDGVSCDFEAAGVPNNLEGNTTLGAQEVITLCCMMDPKDTLRQGLPMRLARIGHKGRTIDKDIGDYPHVSPGFMSLQKVACIMDCKQ